MTLVLVKLLFILFVIYAVLPRLVADLFSYKVFKQSTAINEVAVTFDDGPHSGYTPRLLDLLHQYNIKATFFVLGSKAKKHPELIRRMYEEGHLIGVHNYVHWTNSLMTPWRVRKQVNESVRVIEEITGEKPVFYRPPWGMLNLFDFVVHKNIRIVLWSLMVWDWRTKGGKERIRKRLLKRVKAGDVILLHDSGETIGAERHAPFHMIEALEEVLIETNRQGLKFVRIDEMLNLHEQAVPHMGLWKKTLVSVWMKWERLFHLIFNVKPIDPNNPMLHIRMKKYSGKRLQLDDGQLLNKGDTIAELHLDNALLYRMGRKAKSPMHLAIQMIRQVEQLLPEMAKHLTRHPDYRNVRALYGVTMIHRGTKQLGFTVITMRKDIFYFMARMYLKLILSVIHPQGKERLKVRSELLVPKIIAISKEELLRKYSENASVKLDLA